MTLQDLKENRDRVIKTIGVQFQCPGDRNTHIVEVMKKMAAWISVRADIQDMKATKGNIDKFITMATLSYIKNEMKASTRQDVKEYWDAHHEAKHIEQLNNL